MEIRTHDLNAFIVAEIISDHLVISDVESSTDLVGSLYYQNFDGVILYQEQLTPAFFDLKNKMAGDVLQKFSNYRLKLVIVGNFSALTNQSIKDFIWECNRGKQVNFVNSLSEAINALTV